MICPMSYPLSIQASLPLNSSLTLEEKSRAMSWCSNYSGSGNKTTPMGLTPIVDAARLSVVANLTALRNLDDGWYDEGSVGIHAVVIDRAKSVIESALKAGLPKPEITPTPHGTISIEWESRNVSAYLEIGRTKMNGFLQTEGNEPSLISDVSVLPETIYASLNSIISPQKGDSIALPSRPEETPCRQAA
jgi:hypothetical protein